MDGIYIEYILEKMQRGVAFAMSRVRGAQLLGIVRGSEVKSHDGTLVTDTDKASEAILRRELGDIDGVRFKGEEGTESGSGDYTLLVDPLDGTRPYVNGMLTSTVIAALLDPDGTMAACVIGEPISGRMWYATARRPTSLRLVTYKPDGNWDVDVWHTSPAVECPVWKGELSLQTTVFIDATHGFVRKAEGGQPRQIFDDLHMHDIRRNVAGKSNILMAGSNGLHHALVANGGERVAGAITTAVGGAWDVCGALLVFNSGGHIRAYRKEVTPDGYHTLYEADPFKPNGYDILVVGNSVATCLRLVKCFEDLAQTKVLSLEAQAGMTGH